MENKTIRVWDKTISNCSECEMCRLGVYGTQDKNKIHTDCKYAKPLTKEDIKSCGFEYQYNDLCGKPTHYYFRNYIGKRDSGKEVVCYSLSQNENKIIIQRTDIPLCIFKGTVNNFPEFKLILKMLNIE